MQTLVVKGATLQADTKYIFLKTILLFLCYRKVDTGSVKKWLERLQVENVPILVCLTFADQLYAELDGKESVRYQLEIEQSVRFSIS